MWCSSTSEYRGTSVLKRSFHACVNSLTKYAVGGGCSYIDQMPARASTPVGPKLLRSQSLMFVVHALVNRALSWVVARSVVEGPGFDVTELLHKERALLYGLLLSLLLLSMQFEGRPLHQGLQTWRPLHKWLLWSSWHEWLVLSSHVEP